MTPPAAGQETPARSRGDRGPGAGGSIRGVSPASHGSPLTRGIEAPRSPWSAACALRGVLSPVGSREQRSPASPGTETRRENRHAAGLSRLARIEALALRSMSSEPLALADLAAEEAALSDYAPGGWLAWELED